MDSRFSAEQLPMSWQMPVLRDYVIPSSQLYFVRHLNSLQQQVSHVLVTRSDQRFCRNCYWRMSYRAPSICTCGSVAQWSDAYSLFLDLFCQVVKKFVAENITPEFIDRDFVQFINHVCALFVLA